MLQANNLEASFGNKTMSICKQLLNIDWLCNCFQFSRMQFVFLDSPPQTVSSTRKFLVSSFKLNKMYQNGLKLQIYFS